MHGSPSTGQTQDRSVRHGCYGTMTGMMRVSGRRQPQHRASALVIPAPQWQRAGRPPHSTAAPRGCQHSYSHRPQARQRIANVCERAPPTSCSTCSCVMYVQQPSSPPQPSPPWAACLSQTNPASAGSAARSAPSASPRSRSASSSVRSSERVGEVGPTSSAKRPRRGGAMPGPPAATL